MITLDRRTVTVINLFTGVLFDFQQIDFQTLLHLTSLFLGCCLLHTQHGDLEEEEEKKKSEERTF